MAGWVLAALLGQSEPIERTVDVTKEIVVLVNENVPESVALGEYYAKRRGIPAERICRVRTVATEVCTWPQLRADILEPLKKFLESRPDVLTIVPTWGVPVKTSEEKPENDGKGGAMGYVTGRDYACIDREIELLRVEHELDGWTPSKVFNQDRRLTREDSVYVVCRLDGPTVEDARALVEGALYGEAYGVEGTTVIDTRGLDKAGDGYTECDRDMKRVVEICERHGLPFAHDDKPEVLDLATLSGAAHYWGWYTGTVVCSRPEWRFNRGAVGAHLHSFSAGQLRSKDQTWTGPLVRHGISGTWGTVYEPLIAGFPNGTIFFDRFLRGYTFGESLQMANQMSSWMAVFVGDPLYAPYAKGMKDRQAANRALAKEAYAGLVKALDAGDLGKAAGIVQGLDGIGVVYAGAEDVGFLARETRSRLAWPDRRARGTVADLRRALDSGDARKALALSPASWDANRLRAKAAVAAGDWNEALQAVEIAAKVEVDFDLRLWKGMALRRLAKLKDALAELEAALAMRFDLEAVRQIGEILIEQRNFAEAIARLESVYRRYPNDREVAGELGKAYVATREWKKAIAVLEQAVKDLPAAWSEVRDYVACQELLLAAVRGDGDKPRAQALAELVRELKSGKVRPTPSAQAARMADTVDDGAANAEKLGDLPAYDDKFNGVARLRLGNRTGAEIQVFISGPMALTLRLRSGKDADAELVPGIYRVLVVATAGGKPRTFLREQRLEPSRWYGLGLDEKFKLVRPGK